jgi:hypothetical protein
MIKQLYIVTILIFCFLHYSSGQNHNIKKDSTLSWDEYSSINKLEVLSSTETHLAKELAIIDIENGHVKLFIVGGISPITYKGQRRFERKFNLQYFDYGDLPPKNFEALIVYNEFIFDYLTQKYGEKWKKRIRPDVEGIHLLVNSITTPNTR